jgi:hypothetical protein
MNWLKRRFDIEGKSNWMLLPMCIAFLLVLSLWVSILGSLGIGIFLGNWSYFQSVLGYIAGGLAMAIIGCMIMALADTISIRGSYRG